MVVFGGGHAGTAAAAAAARVGARTALVTPYGARDLGTCSCNPSVGGVGKGVAVREVDALGGVIGAAADRAGVMFRVLNRAKGPAVWGPRAQIDRALFKAAVRDVVRGVEGLGVLEGRVADVVLQGEEGDKRVGGIRLEDGRVLSAKTVVIATGTFLGGEIHIGWLLLFGYAGATDVERPRVVSCWPHRRGGNLWAQQIPKRRRLQNGPVEDRHAAEAGRQDD